jgi:ubiquinone/menaquinone biosynthesis C-methylase UbiE
VPQPDHVESARATYDLGIRRYLEVVGTVVSPAIEGAIDRSLLSAFVEVVEHGPAGRVADLGCGPGRVTAFLAERGLPVIGVDVSGAMLAAARSAHPELEFEEGALDALPIGSGTLAGAVCWYSIIHTPPELLGPAFVELHRVLMPGGAVLLGFQSGAGESIERITEADGTRLSLATYRHGVDEVTRSLQGAGLHVFATAQRDPEHEHETTPQAFVFARR